MKRRFTWLMSICLLLVWLPNMAQSQNDTYQDDSQYFFNTLPINRWNNLSSTQQDAMAKIYNLRWQNMSHQQHEQYMDLAGSAWQSLSKQQQLTLWTISKTFLSLSEIEELQSNIKKPWNDFNARDRAAFNISFNLAGKRNLFSMHDS